MTLGDRDLFVNVVGGMEVEEPALDLPLCLAVASAYRGGPCPRTWRPSARWAWRGRFAGVGSAPAGPRRPRPSGFTRCVLPASDHKRLERAPKGITLEPVTRLRRGPGDCCLPLEDRHSESRRRPETLGIHLTGYLRRRRGLRLRLGRRGGCIVGGMAGGAAVWLRACPWTPPTGGHVRQARRPPHGPGCPGGISPRGGAPHGPPLLGLDEVTFQAPFSLGQFVGVLHGRHVRLP